MNKQLKGWTEAQGGEGLREEKGRSLDLKNKGLESEGMEGPRAGG